MKLRQRLKRAAKCCALRIPMNSRTADLNALHRLKTLSAVASSDLL